ncbi:RNA-directed DNA polymerase, eukaryota [Tanacetum coccineum]
MEKKPVLDIHSNGEDVGLKKFSNWEEDSEVEVVPDSKFEEEIPKTNVKEVSVGQNDVNSKDPFNLYDLLNKKKDDNNKRASVEYSLKFPPGFTPKDAKEAREEHPNMSNESKRVSGEGFHSLQEEETIFGVKKYCSKKKAKDDVAESMCSGHFQKAETPRSGLAQKAKKDWVKELCVNNKLHFLSLQKTEMENIEIFFIKSCLGNFAFDYVYSAYVGNSGGILYVWDPKSFKKLNVMVSDYFVIIRGVWVLNGKNIHIISVYAPQELIEKKMLWDYLSIVMENWNGEVVIMGDFNEVHKKAERFGSVFNVQGVDAFNLFISNAGLEEVPLGGCSFTWCHKSATKMSKQDRFLISESLMSSCPNISAVSLDRYLSDHRLILMRELHYDYGPVLFRFFHYWFDMEGFDKLVEDSWKESHVADTNALINMMKKLKYLKEKIRVAQKANIKWVIEGDENSKYYHGILNKKRSQLAIRSILVDGNWIESPELVKMTKDKIKKAVWDFRIDKSPGLDRFTFGFYRRYWKIIESDVVDAMICFFQQGYFPKGGNSYFIALIPKTPDANMVKDFRPISLIRSLYKIIAKILANCLVVVLGNLVNEVQLAFVVDRQILDGGSVISFFVYSGYGKPTRLIPKSGGRRVESGWDYVLERDSGGYCYSAIKMEDEDPFNMRNGANTLFWEDAWRGGIAFKSLYPKLYALELSKNIDVASKMTHCNLGYSFRRDPRGGVEQAQFDLMLEKVEGTLLADMRDRWVWSLEGSGEFSVASVRKLIDDNMLPEVASKTRWIKAMPIKVNVHAWKVKLDCLPTRINISRRGMDIESILCPMCGEAAESSRHIFFISI